MSLPPRLLLLSLAVSAAVTTAQATPTPRAAAPQQGTVIHLPITYALTTSSSSSLLGSPVDQLTAVLAQWGVSLGVSVDVGLSVGASLTKRELRAKQRGLLGGGSGTGKGLLADVLAPAVGTDGKGGLVGGLVGAVGGLVGGLGTVLDEGWGGEVVRGRNGMQDDWFGVLSFGTPAQSMKLTFDTGSTDIWLFSTPCPTCSLSNHTSYSPSSSRTSSLSSSSAWSISYGDDTTINGQTATDTIFFPSDPSSSSPSTPVSLPGVSFAMATSLSQSLYTHYTASGLVGLAQARLATVKAGQGSIFNRMAKEGRLKENVMGIRLGSRGGSDGGGSGGAGVTVGLGLHVGTGGSTGQEGDGGAFVMGGVEESWIVGGKAGLKWMGVTSSLYWGVPMTAVRTSTGVPLLDPITKPRAILDTGTSIILTSTALAASINTQVPLSSFDPQTEIWTVPCETTRFPLAPNIFFTLGGHEFGLPVEEMAWKDDGTGTGRCLSGVQGGLDAFTVLGDLFLRNHYLALSYGADGKTLSAGLGARTDVQPIR